MITDDVQINKNNSCDFINIIITSEPRACVDYRIRLSIALFLEFPLHIYSHIHI